MQPAVSQRRPPWLLVAALALSLLVLPQLARPLWKAQPLQAVAAERPAALKNGQEPGSHAGGPVPGSGLAPSIVRSDARSLASSELRSTPLSVAGSETQLAQPAAMPSPSPPPAPKVLHVIRTHVLNDLVNKMFTQMTAELGPEAVFILMDDTKERKNGTRIWRDPWNPGQQMLLVNEKECKNASSFHQEMYMEGHTPMGMMYKYLEPVGFEYIWFIDWDVLCNGHYRDCFTMPQGTEQDLLVTNLENLEGSKWEHADKLVGELATLPRERRWKSFFPLVRFSRKFLQRVYTQLQVSSGFCELYTPTLCSLIEGCTSSNIPSERLGEFGYVMPWEDQRCSPPKEPDNKFYHPCKGIKWK